MKTASRTGLAYALLLALVGFVLAVGMTLTAGPASHAQAQLPPAGVSQPESATILASDDDESPFAFSGVIRDQEREPVPGVEITITGDGFESSGETDDTGAWRISVPGPGTYTVTLNVETLPEGLTLRDPAMESREFEIGASTQQGVLFAFGDPPAQTADPDSPAPPSETESAPSPSPTGQSFGTALTQRVINGLIFGLLLAVAAIGITLIFGTTGVNNFAHGELLTFGGVVFYFTTTVLGLHIVLSVALTLLIAAIFGWLHDAVLFKPLRKRRVGLVQVLIVTIGLSIALRYTYQFFIGGGAQQLRINRGAAISIGPANISTSVLIAAGVAIIVLIGVGLFLTQTRVGKATRAVSDNSSLAAASGINVNRVIRIVWVTAGLLTGLAGLLYTYFIGGNIRWDTGFSILLLLFAAVTLGGLGSAFGALIGAIIIGLVTEVSTLWLPADIRYAVALLILILVLLIRPQGILGRKERIG